MSKTLSLPHRKALEVDSSITAGIVAQRGYWTATEPAELAALGFTRDQCRVPALVIPSHGVDGGIVTHQAKPDNPRRNDKGKIIKYETPAGSVMRLDICPIDSVREQLLGKSDLYITEGIKKGDSAAVRGLCCIALPGVWNWRGTNEQGGSTELADWDKVNVKGRTIYIVFDNDVMVKPAVLKALRRLSGMLRRRGARSVVPIVPNKEGHTGKLGLDDFFALHGTKLELHQCADHSILDERTIVINNRNLADVSADGLDALKDNNIPPALFVRGGELVRIVHDERDIPKIQSITLAAMRGILARSATWVRKNKDGETEVSPPPDVVEDLMSLGAWPLIPPVVAITRAPVLAKNGVLSMSPGYCPDSAFFIACRDTWPKWDADLAAAVDYILNDMLGDFPFASDADRAHALALMILPIVRPVIDGSTPLHLIDAPVQGTGKSILARICMMPTAGSEIAATPGTKDEEEWRKKIASSLLEGRSYIFFDDLSRKIESESLNLALTSREFTDRKLQETKNINLPIRCVWIATTNNAELSRDIVERTVWIRLDSGTENPSERPFAHPDIEGWVTQNRQTIVSALCVIVRAWLNAGKPLGRKRHPRYHEWSSVIGGILEVAGVPGFLDNIHLLKSSANTLDDAWRHFMARWWEDHEQEYLKAGDLRTLFEADEELAGLLGPGNEASRTTRLGYLLKKRIGVVLGGLRIQPSGGKAGGTRSFRLEVVEGKPPLFTINPHYDFEPKHSNPHSTPIMIFEPKNTEIVGVDGNSGGLDDPTRARSRARENPTGGCSKQPPTPTIDFEPPLSGSTAGPELAPDQTIIEEVEI